MYIWREKLPRKITSHTFFIFFYCFRHMKMCQSLDNGNSDCHLRFFLPNLLCRTWGLVEGPLEGSPIGVANNFCPVPCPEVAPEFVAPVSPWLGYRSDWWGQRRSSTWWSSQRCATRWPYQSWILGTGWIWSSWLMGVHCRVSTCLPSSRHTLGAVGEGLSRQRGRAWVW